MFVAAPLHAQDFNTRVVVSNDYDASIPDLSKGFVKMSVPDSLTVIPRNFEYSVFDTPYRGTEEFSPYSVLVRPEAGTYTHKRFYASAGAGYTFHPELCFVFEPEAKGRVRFATFGDFRGYSGKYCAVSNVRDEMNGHDFGARAGANASFDLKKADIRLGVSYRGIYPGADNMLYGGFNAFKASFEASSSKLTSLDLGLKVGFTASSDLYGGERTSDNRLDVGLTVGHIVFGSSRFGVDALLALDNERGSSQYDFSLKPRYILEIGGFVLNAGLKLEFSNMYHRPSLLSPDVTASFNFKRIPLKVFAGVSGGATMFNHIDLKEWNHFYTALYGGRDNRVENIRIFAGLKGAVTSSLDYGLDVSYTDYASTPMFGVDLLRFVQYRVFRAGVNLAYRQGAFTASGKIGVEQNCGGELPSDVFTAPTFSGSGTLEYRFRSRLLVGLDLSGEAERRSELCTLPAYFDFGLHANYRINRFLTAWLKGSNLFGRTIHRTPLFAEKGPAVTAGISVVF